MATIFMKIDRNNGTPLNDQMVVTSGAMSYGGTLTVSNIGGSLQAGDKFQLFSAPAYARSFAVTNLPALNSGLAWSNSLSVNGSITVVAAVSQVPANVTWSIIGTNLNLAWPADHTGWRLLVQTNDLGAGISMNANDWTTVPNSAATNTLVVPMNFSGPAEFYRLVFP